MDRILISATIATSKGFVRSDNEDNFYLGGLTGTATSADDEFIQTQTYECAVLFAVCDGMGGLELGKRASEIIVHEIKKHEKSMLSVNSEEDERMHIEKFIKQSNEKVCDEISLKKKRLGSTLAMLLIGNGYGRFCNIGDSRGYLFRNGKLMQMSIDHDEAASLVRAGILSRESALTDPRRHRLTQHIGVFESEMVIVPEISPRFMIEEKDLFLLCSDGLTDMVLDKDIQDIMNRGASDHEISKALLKRALDNGGKDNVTLITAEIEALHAEEPQIFMRERFPNTERLSPD
jgi:protein phosphatase